MQRTEAIQLLAKAMVSRMSEGDRLNEALGHWFMEPGDAGWERLTETTKNLMKSRDYPHPEDDLVDLAEFAVSASLERYMNDWLSRRASQELGRTVTVVGAEPRLESCPCCGFKSLPNRGEYDVCSVCLWEDDGCEDPKRRSGPNRSSMENYRTTCEFEDAVDTEQRDPRFARGTRPTTSTRS